MCNDYLKRKAQEDFIKDTLISNDVPIDQVNRIFKKLNDEDINNLMDIRLPESNVQVSDIIDKCYAKCIVEKTMDSYLNVNNNKLEGDNMCKNEDAKNQVVADIMEKCFGEDMAEKILNQLKKADNDYEDYLDREQKMLAKVFIKPHLPKAISYTLQWFNGYEMFEVQLDNSKYNAINLIEMDRALIKHLYDTIKDNQNKDLNTTGFTPYQIGTKKKMYFDEVNSVYLIQRTTRGMYYHRYSNEFFNNIVKNSYK